MRASGTCAECHTRQLTARPSFEVPDFLLERALKRNAARMIDQLRDAIAARTARR